MTLYNSYPSCMEEINPYNSDDLQDLFTFCWESEESRQAYKDNVYEMYEHLRIIWIRKDLNLGYAIGEKNNIIKYYKIGSKEHWLSFNRKFAATFVNDNS